MRERGSVEAPAEPLAARDGAAERPAPRARRRLSSIAFGCALAGVLGAAAVGVAHSVDRASVSDFAVPAIGLAHVLGAAIGVVLLWQDRSVPGAARSRRALFSVAAPLLSAVILFSATLPARREDKVVRHRQEAQADVRQVWRIVGRNRAPDDPSSWDYWLSDLVDPEEREHLKFPDPRDPEAAAPTPWDRAVEAFLARFDQRPDLFRPTNIRVDTERGTGVMGLRGQRSARRESVLVVRRGSVWFLSLRPVDGTEADAPSGETPPRRE